jgi:hypothetical protein
MTPFPFADGRAEIRARLFNVLEKNDLGMSAESGPAEAGKTLGRKGIRVPIPNLVARVFEGLGPDVTW